MANICLTSCVMLAHSYPASWPALANIGGECASVEGVFYEQSTQYDVKSDTIPYYTHLSAAFWTTVFPPGRRIERLDLLRIELRKSQKDGSLEVLLWYEDELLNERRLDASKDEFHCGSDGIQILRKSERVSREGIIATASETLHLRKSKDGSLVLHVKESGVGAALLVPFVVNYSHWYMFGRVLQ